MKIRLSGTENTVYQSDRILKPEFFEKNNLVFHTIFYVPLFVRKYIGRRPYNKIMRSKIFLPVLLVTLALLGLAFIPGSKPSKLKSTTVAGTEPGIRFIEADWNKALAEAKKQKKLIFLDAYASWCGPCKLLKKNTFPDKAAGDFFNANYINVAIDMEKGEGPALSEKYGVNAYPTLIITDADGAILTYTKGYLSPGQLIDFGEYGLKQKKQ